MAEYYKFSKLIEQHRKITIVDFGTELKKLPKNLILYFVLVIAMILLERLTQFKDPNNKFKDFVNLAFVMNTTQKESKEISCTQLTFENKFQISSFS